ncbi:MAG TPA: bifunctional DNA-formamidopyrimidine glycosylase/DNA-(apurinic or apyrimidinic site) lyase [Gemmatimonadaceae bacterium]|jgi:formamidopyrimidine-DNA glycosylase
MPELPEVERAIRRLRRAIEGKRIKAVATYHPSQKRQLPDSDAERIAGLAIESVERRGKHQLLRLSDGSSLHVHFRMNGDWILSETTADVDRFTRAAIELEDGTRAELHDRRALSAIAFHPPGVDPLPKLGMEANDRALDAAHLKGALAARKIAIKPALMDQSVLAGLGNIYAAEALWRAQISPRARASSLSLKRVDALVTAIKSVLNRKNRPPGRYTELRGRNRFAVYDREGEPCPRCGTPIRRIVQAGRSTYFCPNCQRR